MNSNKHDFRGLTRLLLGFMGSVIWVCVMMSQAEAHKVNVFAYVEGDRIVVEGYFSANVKAQGCLVEIFDETGKKIYEGKTDQKGIYSFKLVDLPAFEGNLLIVLEAGMGHKAQYTLSASDIPNPGKKEVSPKKESSQDELPKNQSLNMSTGPVGSSKEIIDQATLTAALDPILDKKLEPLVKMLARQEKLLLEEKDRSPRLHDIIGGIGWIMGLVGLTAFWLSRKQSEKKDI